MTGFDQLPVRSRNAMSGVLGHYLRRRVVDLGSLSL